MRRFDLRSLQERLSGIGVSSLGRSETHVLANVDKVLGILHRLAGRSWTPLTPEEPMGYQRARAMAEQHAEALFGPAPPGRRVPIMVTLPTEAAHDEALVRALVQAGMDIARINCAHDSRAEWVAMARHVRHAARAAGRSVRVLMDLGGPKLRTGPVGGRPGGRQAQAAAGCVRPGDRTGATGSEANGVVGADRGGQSVPRRGFRVAGPDQGRRPHRAEGCSLVTAAVHRRRTTKPPGGSSSPAIAPPT